MSTPQPSLSGSPEALVVALARTGDQDAFAELVRRRQSWIRNLMRHCCGDRSLADDLAQQVFLTAWKDIGRLREPRGFGAWLRRLAINVWRQHARRDDPLREAEAADEVERRERDGASIALDLDRALLTLADPVRLCVVLSCREGMSHGEIAALAALPLGTVKSHIRRGTQRLQDLLSDYREPSANEVPT